MIKVTKHVIVKRQGKSFVENVTEFCFFITQICLVSAGPVHKHILTLIFNKVVPYIQHTRLIVFGQCFYNSS